MENQVAEEDFSLEEWVTFRQKSSGVRVGISGLIHMLKESFKQKRRQALHNPADATKSEYGQGRYLQEANENRSICAKKVWRGEGKDQKMDKHNQKVHDQQYKNQTVLV